MTIDEIRELIRLVTDTGVAELEVQRGENRVRIRTGLPLETAAPAPAPVYTHAAPGEPAAAAKQEAAASKPESNIHYVKSPIVGTFYGSPSPGSAAFVQVGEHVTAGKVLCIIESMKLMNEIEADVTGVIESCLVQNAQPVEYGEALFGIRPL